jgi:probable O-glycosylation ligase (exosortase A-associated)
MAVLTLVGVVGTFAIEPFIGVAVYYFFAVLRPQYLWKWALPDDIGWSGFVAWTTLIVVVWQLMNGRPEPPNGSGRRFSFAHKTFFVFGVWISLTYVTALNHEAAWQWFVEYLKLFVMFGVAAVTIRTVRQVWYLYALATIALIYIAYELNYLYVTAYRLDIYHNGYGGLDNNGAGLMLAMGIPLAMFAWESQTKLWRWIFLAGVPLLLHAVLMSYSRGAMVSLVVAAPLLLFRSRRRIQFLIALIAVGAMVPYLAGKEIRQRFFSVQEYQTDSTANERFDSWSAAFKIANEYPIFGVGIRNSNLLSYQFGADMEGRTIHSQYLQTLADAGYPGLGLYLLALGSTWFALVRTRRALKKRKDPEAGMARSMLSGIEGSLLVFCFGASFLSLEVFELPYVVALLAIQTAWLTRFNQAPVPSVVPVGIPVSPRALRAPQPRAS